MATKIANTKRAVRSVAKVASKGKAKATPVATKGTAKASGNKLAHVVLTASGKPIDAAAKVSINPSAKIKAVGANPYRAGSKKAAAFGKFKVGQTCAAAIEACGDADRLRWAIRREYVKVA